jgi:hypothetical protein
MTKERKLVYNGFDYDELYDLRRDPHEIVNLLSSSAAADDGHTNEIRSITRMLYRRMWRFAYENGEQSINPYIMVALATCGPGEAFMENHDDQSDQ